jgi:hypothetical protein
VETDRRCSGFDKAAFSALPTSSEDRLGQIINTAKTVVRRIGLRTPIFTCPKKDSAGHGDIDRFVQPIPVLAAHLPMAQLVEVNAKGNSSSHAATLMVMNLRLVMSSSRVFMVFRSKPI